MHSNISLVLITRVDPPVTLAKLRLKNRLIALKGFDLRFSTEEAKAFFEKISLPVSNKNLLDLTQKTEGWIVGLQLAGISMKGRAY